MKHINTYANISEYNVDTNRDLYNSVSYIKDENRVEYNFMIKFADPEVGRVLHANGLIADANKSSIEELATITSLNPSGKWNGSYFYNNKVITQFPELKYFTGLTNLYGTFQNCSSLTTAPIIPEGVTNLSYTFNSCTNLTTAPVIPEGVTDLSYTFYGCTSLTTAPIIPSSVISLDSTFSGCSNLTTVPDIPSSVIILLRAFNGCTSLTTAPIIPEGVTDLRYTFYGCTSLTTAPIIPSSVNNLSGTFNGCTNIDGIYIINIVTPPSYSNSLSNVQAICVPDESVQLYKEASGWIEFADKIYPFSESPFEVSGKFADPEVGRVLHANGLIANPTHSTREELATITSLNPSGTGDGSYFYNNKVITQFPELKYFTGVTDLSYAFSGCTSLTTAPDIPSSVTNLSYTFNSCSSLTTAPDIPEGVTDLEATFSDCSSIDGIYIINAVTPPSYSDSLSNVQAICVPDESVDAYKTASGWIEFADKIYPFSEGTFGINGIFADPEVGRVLHANGLIADANKSSIEELATITSLRSYFNNNRVITQFPELKYCTGVTDLSGAFPQCSNLTTAPVIPEGVTNLSGTFYGCTNLTTAPVIPEGVTNLSGTFYGCTNIDGIYIINIVTPVTYSGSLSNVQAIYVPDESVQLYKEASGWIEFADKILPMSDKSQ